MKFDKELSAKYFKQTIPDEYFAYLAERNITSTNYLDDLRANKVGMVTENLFCVGDVEYCVEFILGAGCESIYDLIRVNQFYGISAGEGTAFAVVLGDDYLFFKPNDPCVYFFSRDLEKDFCIAKDYCSFKKTITYKEQ